MVLAPQGKRTLSHRVFATVFFCAMAVIVAFTVLGAFFVQNTLADATSANLSQETELIAAALNEQQEPIAFLRSLDREDLRITLINKDGSVAYDNEASPSTLPNHGDRPEVIEAFENGSGSAERASSTLDEIMLYRAVALDNGQVVRLAQAQPGVAAILLSMVAPMLLIAAAGAVLSFFLARRESRAIIAPLQEVDLDHPRRSYEHAYAEMVPMLERIESQRQELKRQMAVLADNDRMRREFTANITHELKTPLTAISGYAELDNRATVTAVSYQKITSVSEDKIRDCTFFTDFYDTPHICVFIRHQKIIRRTSDLKSCMTAHCFACKNAFFSKKIAELFYDF